MNLQCLNIHRYIINIYKFNKYIDITISQVPKNSWQYSRMLLQYINNTSYFAEPYVYIYSISPIGYWRTGRICIAGRHIGRQSHMPYISYDSNHDCIVVCNIKLWHGKTLAQWPTKIQVKKLVYLVSHMFMGSPKVNLEGKKIMAKLLISWTWYTLRVWWFQKLITSILGGLGTIPIYNSVFCNIMRIATYIRTTISEFTD